MKKFLKALSWGWQDVESFSAHLPLLAGAGFDGVEPVFGGGLFSGNNHVETGETLRRRCMDLGLRIPSMRGGRFFWRSVAAPDKAAREKGLDYGRNALDALAAMGGELLLVVPGGVRPDVTFEDHFELAVDFFLRLAEEAEKRGLKIGAENVESGFPLSVLDWRAFLSRIGGPHAGMYLDAGNIVWLDRGYPEHWIRSLKEHIFQVHIKGAQRGERVCSLFEGDVDWGAVMRALKDIDYAGWIIVEPPALANPVLRHYFNSLAQDMEVLFTLD